MFTHPLPYFSILAFAYKSLKKFYHAEIFRKKAFWSKDFLSEIRMLDVQKQDRRRFSGAWRSFYESGGSRGHFAGLMWWLCIPIHPTKLRIWLNCLVFKLNIKYNMLNDLAKMGNSFSAETKQNYRKILGRII